MKIVIVTQDAPMYMAEFLDRFLDGLSTTAHRVEGIVVCSPFFQKSRCQEIKERYHFYGPLDFLRLAGHICWHKGLALLHPLAGCHSVGNVIRKYCLQRCPLTDINGREFLNYLRDSDIDLVISIATPKLFKAELLQTPLHGCINYHTALLPQYRGRQPLFWALMHDESEVGISVHEMDEQLDSGPIIAQTKVPVKPDDSLHSLYQKTICRGPQLLLEAIAKLAAGDAERIANDASRGSCFQFPTREEARRFRNLGKHFF